MRLIFCFISILLSVKTFAYTVTGTVTDTKGKPLAFTSLLIKGTTKGTTANAKGEYSLVIDKGDYILLCQYVGYKSVEKKIAITNKDIIVDFELASQDYNLKEVVVKSGSEDPAYEIIRNAIKKRPTYQHEMKKFQCDVYIKGQLQLRDYPKKIFGQKVDFEDGDTSKKKIMFLSETVAKYSVDEPNSKVEVTSTKVSGNSDGFGFSSPQIVSFYDNNIALGRGLNPRGFVSPIASNALNFYKYKFEGTFYENGKEINRIKVIPKRKYEPLFTGYINIIEDEWRIYSVQLQLLKEQQMQFIDTLNIDQIYVPVKDKWVIKQQVLYPAGKFFSFDFFGNFVQVYDNFNTEPVFPKKFFDNVVMKIYDSANKKPIAYWDSIRPVPLSAEEKLDYKKKDSLEQVRKDPKYLDSLDRIRNRVSITNIIITGKTFSRQKKEETLSVDPLFTSIDYNSVEGTMVHITPKYTKRFSDRRRLVLNPDIRYGIGNKHFNGSFTGNYNYGKKYFSNLTFGGGKKVFQFNNANPITARANSYSTLFYVRNYLKIYEAWFAKLGYSKGLGNGMTVSGNVQFQDRSPLNNLQKIAQWGKISGRSFTPNYPTEISATNMPHNQALIGSVGVSWRPGAQYIEIPGRKFSVGSRYPTFTLNYTQGFNGVLGSDVDYSKWRFTIADNINMNLGGRFSYKLEVGGFLNDKKTFIPDYQHFQGNRTAIATDYMNSFQLAPYYQYSTTTSFYALLHAEYHLNGLLTNKIPVLKKWN